MMPRAQLRGWNNHRKPTILMMTNTNLPSQTVGFRDCDAFFWKKNTPDCFYRKWNCGEWIVHHKKCMYQAGKSINSPFLYICVGFLRPHTYQDISFCRKSGDHGAIPPVVVSSTHCSSLVLRKILIIHYYQGVTFNLVHYVVSLFTCLFSGVTGKWM